MASRLFWIVVAAFELVAWLFFGSPARAVERSIYEASWKAVIPDGSKGYQVGISANATAFALPAETRDVLLRFDTYDPPTKNPFNVERNIDGRPQREVAIFWNGSEVARRFCPTDLTGSDGQSVSVEFRFVTGGASLGVRVGKALIYDHYLLPDVSPFEVHFVQPGNGATISGATYGVWGLRPVTPAAVHVRAIDTQLIDKDHTKSASIVNFPLDSDQFGRVICTLTLAKTPHGYDPWDRIGEIYIIDDTGERYELLRFMTPYRRGYTWKQDVTDLLPVLRGKKRVLVDCTTYSQGWLASVDFTFYRGPAARRPYRVVNLWNTTAVIGRKTNEFGKQVPPQTIVMDPKADFVAVRLIATGHGEDPNTDNAAEFISLWRKLWVGNASYQNTLWKDDNYLNPCRPQGGTWKYDRAGWGPGAVVEPWLVDVTGDVPPGANAVFRYEIQPYENKTPNNGDPARYVIGSQLIFYRDSAAASKN